MIPLLMAAVVMQGKPDGAAMISQMFACYAKATSMTGTIHMTQSAQGRSVVIDTALAYESPAKLFIKQVLNGGAPRTWLVTSDGTRFSYDYFNDVRLHADKIEPSRLVEPVNGVNGALNFQDIFRATLRSLGDVSIPEILAIGGKTGFKTIKSEIATIDYSGTGTVGSTPVTILRGLWRTSPDLQPSAAYEMDIAADGQLKRYSQDETVSVQLSGQRTAPERIVTIWDLDLNLNAKPDESLFNVVMQPID